ncbi:MAG: DUF4403 family protein [Verrucomicrobiales bacterium]|nr:DUF4403 family protein [Verrucomicrobiales bacterium]
MKKILLIAGVILLTLFVIVPLATRYLGPRMIFVEPPKGRPIGEFDLPRAETSLVAVNVAIPLDMMTTLANAKIPEEFEGGEQKDFHKRIKRGRYAWKAVRGDVAFQNTGSNLAFTTAFRGGARFQGDVDAKIITIPLNSTVEIGGLVGGTMSPSVTPRWQIDPQFAPRLSLSEANLSIAGLGGIDISNMLGGSLSQFIQKEAAKLMPALGKQLNLRGEVEKLWSQGYLSQLVNDDPNVWISVTPKKILMAPINYTDPEQISMAIGIQSNTFLTNRDPGQPAPAPLPDLTPLDGPVSTDLKLPIIVSVAELNEVLAEETIEIDTGIGTKIDIHGLEAKIAQGGLLDLKITLQADKSRIGRGVAGDIWVKARPVIDFEAQTLGFSEVELTVETLDKLTTAATWLLEGILTRGIESQLRVDLDDYKEEINEEVQKAIDSADLPPGLDVSLQDLEINLADIYTISRHFPEGEPDAGIVIVINATANMETTLNSMILKPEDAP